MTSLTEKLASTHLGQTSKGSDLYDKGLLVAVPRSENREQYSITPEALPFVGYDIWNAYEVSFMTVSNVPMSGVLKIKYPCNNPSIVESKSIKLYLNSFNMTPLKATIQESKDFFLKQVEADLSELLQTEVKAVFHDKFTSLESRMLPGFTPIEELIDLDSLVCNNFKEAPELLEVVEVPMNIKFSFSSLRSNCRVTHQPDFGDLFIHIEANKSVSLESVFKYVTSFRKESHFHEECVEMIYKRLLDVLQPTSLMVTALYTRRGGISIYPVRANKPELLDVELLDITQYTKRTIKD